MRSSSGTQTLIRLRKYLWLRDSPGFDHSQFPTLNAQASGVQRPCTATSAMVSNRPSAIANRITSAPRGNPSQLKITFAKNLLDGSSLELVIKNAIPRVEIALE